MRLAWLMLLTLGCADPSPASHAGVPIVGGVAHMGDPAVALILIENSAGDIVGLCTGTLISSKIIMTAAHCADAESGGSKWQVYFGYNPFGASDDTYLGLYEVAASAIHPSWNHNDLGAGNDIALLQLGAVGPTTPKPINRTPLGATQIGAPVRLVGYGKTSSYDSTDPIKRQVTSSLLELYTKLIVFGDSTHNTCQGDSGGPNFMTIAGTEVVAGITSFGDVDCSAYGAGTRVDYFAPSFIDPWVASHDIVNCTLDGGCATGCTAPDPDCPCGADGFCTAGCAFTDTDPDCPQGCGSNGVCVTGCPTEDPDCVPTPPMPCEMNGTCVEDCPERDPDCPLVVTGAPCTRSEDCVGGICLPAPDSPKLSYCTALCKPEGSDCPEGMHCVGANGGAHVCVYQGPTPGALGSACQTADDCASKICLPWNDGAICIELCEPEVGCSAGYDCAEMSGGEHACLPATTDPNPAADAGPDVVPDPKDNPWYKCRVSVGSTHRGSPGLIVLVLALTMLVGRGRRVRASLKLLTEVAREPHHRKSKPSRAACELCHGGRLIEGLAPQERDSLDLFRHPLHLCDEVSDRDLASAGKRQQPRVAAAGAAEATTLRPDRKPDPGPSASVMGMRSPTRSVEVMTGRSPSSSRQRRGRKRSRLGSN